MVGCSRQHRTLCNCRVMAGEVGAGSVLPRTAASQCPDQGDQDVYQLREIPMLGVLRPFMPEWRLFRAAAGRGIGGVSRDGGDSQHDRTGSDVQGDGWFSRGVSVSKNLAVLR